jgi:hypothetical protein
MLLREGLDFRYGAHHLKRSIERFLVYPLSNLIATEQVQAGDVVYVDTACESRKLVFVKRSADLLSADTLEQSSARAALRSKRAIDRMTVVADKKRVGKRC